MQKVTEYQINQVDEYGNIVESDRNEEYETAEELAIFWAEDLPYFDPDENKIVRIEIERVERTVVNGEFIGSAHFTLIKEIGEPIKVQSRKKRARMLAGSML